MANTDVKRINTIIKSTLSVIEQSRGAIFEIAENARREVQSLKEEIKSLQYEVQEIIKHSDELEKMLSRSRHKLALISRDFTNHTEEEMKKAYEEADGIRLDLAVTREREKQTIIRRNDIERRLKNAVETVGKAEKLVAQVGTVLDYLAGDLNKLDEHLGNTENKRNLALKIIKTQEDERRRIAREMHDGPAQAMSNVVLKAEICEKLADLDIEKARVELGNLKDITRNCLKDVRRIIYDLRPMSIDDLGLRPTLQKYIDAFKQQHQIGIDLMIRGDDGKIKDSNTTLAIFRIVQESLSNIKKHAQASNVVIQLECVPQHINLRIKDDGRGFDTDRLDEGNRDENGGFGVCGMRERVELLEGSFEIESDIGKGTTVRVQLPYEQQGVTHHG